MGKYKIQTKYSLGSWDTKFFQPFYHPYVSMVHGHQTVQGIFHEEGTTWQYCDPHQDHSPQGVSVGRTNGRYIYNIYIYIIWLNRMARILRQISKCHTHPCNKGMCFKTNHPWCHLVWATDCRKVFIPFWCQYISHCWPPIHRHHRWTKYGIECCHAIAGQEKMYA